MTKWTLRIWTQPKSRPNDATWMRCRSGAFIGPCLKVRKPKTLPNLTRYIIPDINQQLLDASDKSLEEKDNKCSRKIVISGQNCYFIANIISDLSYPIWYRSHSTITDIINIASSLPVYPILLIQWVQHCWFSI